MVYLFNFYWRNGIHVRRNVLETTQLCLMEPPQVKHIQTNPTQFLDSTIIELKILPSDPETSTETSSFHICFSTTQHSLVHIELHHAHSSSLLPALSLSHWDLSPTWQIKFHHFNSSTSNSSPTLNVWKPSFLM